MSFVTGGHAIYTTSPNKASASHVIQEANGSLLVFTVVPSDADPETLPQAIGSLVPEPLIGGRIVG